MKETWRWFGEQDSITLDHVKQAGATGIVTALHHLYDGRVWRPEDIQPRMDVIRASGLDWTVCESIPMETSIKLGNADAPKHIAAWKDTLANLGRAGVSAVCYNFMPVVDWTRTDLMHRLPSTGFGVRFDMVDFVGYDTFVLKRPHAEEDYPAALVANAQDRIAAMGADELAVLERNIIAGLPGGFGAHTRHSISELLAQFSDVDDSVMRDNLIAFLREVVPVAEEVGVKLAIHPDDPPFSLFGLPRVVSTAADVRQIFDAVPSSANGLTLCTGSFGARADNDLVAMAKEFAPRIRFAHLRNVTIEDDGSFHEAEHLDGGTDMLGVIDALLREETRRRAAGDTVEIPIRPDHGHLIGDDIGKPGNPGYSYIGRLKGLAELRGATRAIARAQQLGTK